MKRSGIQVAVGLIRRGRTTPVGPRDGGRGGVIMGLFDRHKDLIGWYKDKVAGRTYATAKDIEKAKREFTKRFQTASQDELLELATNEWGFFNEIAVEYMDDDHLVRYASRRPKIEPTGFIGDSESRREAGEVCAVRKIRSSEALAELYCLYAQPGKNRFWQGSYHNKYGEARQAALEKRIGEKEAELIIRRMIADGKEVTPDSWLAQKITRESLKQELGVSITKETAIEQYKSFPELRRAELLRKMLNDEEIIAVLRDSRYDTRAVKYLLSTIQDEAFLAEYLLKHPASDVNSTIYALAMEVVGRIHTPKLLEPLLFANPLHGFVAKYAIERCDRVETLLKFREKLIALRGNIYQDEKSTHFLNKRPAPSDDNLIYLWAYGASFVDMWSLLNRSIRRFNPNDLCDVEPTALFHRYR